jgi:hypothetical protein
MYQKDVPGDLVVLVNLPAILTGLVLMLDTVDLIP